MTAPPWREEEYELPGGRKVVERQPRVSLLPDGRVLLEIHPLPGVDCGNQVALRPRTALATYLELEQAYEAATRDKAETTALLTVDLEPGERAHVQVIVSDGEGETWTRQKHHTAEEVRNDFPDAKRHVQVWARGPWRTLELEEGTIHVTAPESPPDAGPVDDAEIDRIRQALYRSDARSRGWWVDTAARLVAALRAERAESARLRERLEEAPDSVREP